jgi:poly(A) polymerase
VPTPPSLPDVRKAEALAVADRLTEAGHLALLCGGAVRDQLLDRDPEDFDLATSATPEEGAALFPEAVLVGAQFGVLVLPRPGGDIEVATFRADGLYVDGRRPERVAYSDPPTDAQRRDFTVNGLFQDLVSGEIFDYVGGREDMRRRLVRAIGDPEARFREDNLRILRAVRFALQLNFGIEPRTQAAIERLAPLIRSVSAERRRDELLKILRHGRGAGLRLLQETGLLRHVLPEIDAMVGVTQPAPWHPEGDVFVHTCLVLDNAQVPADSETPVEDERDLLFACLLHDVCKPTTRTVDPDGRIRFNRHDRDGADKSREILEGLRLPRRSVDRVASLIAAHIHIASTPRMRPSKLRRFLGQPDIQLHLALHHADCAGSHGMGEILSFCREQLQAYAEEPILPAPLLTGKDLLALGHAPGPEMGRILRWVQDEQLEGRLESRESAVQRVREVFPSADGEPPHV